LEITEGQSVCTCEFCGTEQTLPRLDSDRKANLYDRANHFRRNNDFDKAMGIYEQILNEDNTDAEAYWSLVLCRYGIEYVEDPSTHKRIPTINRAQYTSIYADENYKAALEHAAVAQKIVYEQEAKTIDEIQKGILAISEKEEPFDVFICYKESDETGRRTPDSVLANDLYHQLSQEGFKVFFARITLEDKLGQEYEPYIFAALNSAKVMVVLGTKPEYFKAVWVKNEWARYLALIRGGAKKILIPAYKDMDPYDLPEEFSHLQAQDMTKLGFMQDLIRGIKKIIGADQPQTVTKETVVVQQGGGGNNAALIKRGNMALEDGEWQKADEFFEEVLNQDAECAEAYLGKWLAKIKRSNLVGLVAYYEQKYSEAETEQLEACQMSEEHISSMVNQYIVEDYFGEAEIRKLYEFDRNYTSELSFRIEQKDSAMAEINSEKLYIRTKQYASGELADSLNEAISKITTILDKRISDSKDNDDSSIASVIASYNAHISQADANVLELYNKALDRRESTYNARINAFNGAKQIHEFETVKKNFQSMHGYKDSFSYISRCDEEIKRLKNEQEAEEERIRQAQIKEAKAKAKKTKTIIAIVTCVSILAVGSGVYINYNNKLTKYNAAAQSLAEGQYDVAISEFAQLEDFKDSQNMVIESKYQKAMSFFDNGQYKEAITILNELSGYSSSADVIKQANAKLEEARLQSIKSSNVGETVIWGEYEQDNDNSNGKENVEWLILDIKDNQALLISKYIIDCQPYNSYDRKVTWENCSLRTYMNGTMISNLFTTEQQKYIVNAPLKNENSPWFGTDGGNDTTDKLFILSQSEAGKYFKTDESREAEASAYVTAKHSEKENSFERACGEFGCEYDMWWLRTPGADPKEKSANWEQVVTSWGEVGYNWTTLDGGISDIGLNVDTHVGIRPVLWIDLSLIK